MPRRGSAKDDAIRRARAAKVDRDAARQRREALIESALTDYYLAASLAEHARDAARRKADALLAEAERTARPHDTAATEAIRRLRELLGGVTETAQLCGLSTTTVRDILAGRDPARAGDTDSQDPGRSAADRTQSAAGGDRHER
jgi:hypothetical protein